MARVLGWVALAIMLLLGGAVALAWTPDRDRAALHARYLSSKKDIVDLGDGLRVHVRDEGPRNGPVLMLLHGSNSSLHTWDEWAKRLSARYRVIRYDQPGHGLTGPHPRAGYRAEAFVDVADRVARHLKIDRFVIAGNSMGGWVAWNYALAHPERLRGLVLIDASGAPEAKSTSIPIGFRLARSPVAPWIGKLTPRWLIARSVEQSMFVQDKVTPAMIDRYHDLLRYPGNRRATLDRAKTPRKMATAAEMATLTTPTLLLWGEKDGLVPVAGANWFKQVIPGATLSIMKDVGHIPMEEAPEESAALLEAWLGGLPR